MWWNYICYRYSIKKCVTNSDHKKVRYKMDFCVFHAVLLVIILLFIIAIIYYHYAKHSSKIRKTYCVTKNMKMEIHEI